MDLRNDLETLERRREGKDERQSIVGLDSCSLLFFGRLIFFGSILTHSRVVTGRTIGFSNLINRIRCVVLMLAA